MWHHSGSHSQAAKALNISPTQKLCALNFTLNEGFKLLTPTGLLLYPCMSQVKPEKKENMQAMSKDVWKMVGIKWGTRFLSEQLIFENKQELPFWLIKSYFLKKYLTAHLKFVSLVAPDNHSFLNCIVLGLYFLTPQK